jgi:hypothetical protein
MTYTKDVVEKFNEAVDINKEYTKNELCLILNTVYKEVYTKKNVKKEKRPPTKYNNFVSENMKKMKEEFPELTRQDLMKKIGEVWRKQKEEDNETEETKEDNETEEEETKEKETEEEETKEEETKEEETKEEETKEEEIQEEKKPKKKVTKKLKLVK